MNDAATVVQSPQAQRALLDPQHNHRLQSLSALQQHNTDPERLAFKFLSRHYLVNDILACAFQRTKHHVHDHGSLAQSLGLEFLTNLGLDQILLAIAQITRLDVWKQQKSKSRTLSALELISQGSAIENRIKLYKTQHQPDDEVLVGALRYDRMNPAACVVCARGHKASNQSMLITIFANAALIYLYVVLSGASPEIGEICERVNENLDLFRCLVAHESPYGPLLPKLLWPLAITGCMKAGKDMALVSSIGMKSTQWQAMGLLFADDMASVSRLMQQCWSVRASDPLSTVDWSSAARSLGAAARWFI